MHVDDALDSGTLETLRALNQEGEPDVVAEVLGLFVNDAPSRLAAIHRARLAADAAGLQRAAHTFKGAAGTIGATALQEACRTLEELGKRGDTGPGAAAAAEQVDREYARAKAAIERLLADA